MFNFVDVEYDNMEEPSVVERNGQRFYKFPSVDDYYPSKPPSLVFVLVNLSRSGVPVSVRKKRTEFQRGHLHADRNFMLY